MPTLRRYLAQAQPDPKLLSAGALGPVRGGSKLCHVRRPARVMWVDQL
jgi:hypothetical protein